MTTKNERKPVGQAKALSPDQQKIVIGYLAQCSKHSTRDACMFLFTVKAGLRAIEVALLEWGMVYDLDGNIGDFIEIPTRITKGGKKRSPPPPRVIPMHKDLKDWLTRHHADMKGYTGPTERVFLSQQGYKFDRKKMAAFFWRLYRKVGFHKCSSHSGRRTFITNAARQITRAGGSLLDVQNLAGHRSLQTTQIYIEVNPEAKRKVIDLL